MTTEHERNISITAFSGWEFNRVYIDIKDGDTLLPIDMKLEDAKKLASDLMTAITQYEEMEVLCKEHFKREKEDEERDLQQGNAKSDDSLSR